MSSLILENINIKAISIYIYNSLLQKTNSFSLQNHWLIKSELKKVNLSQIL